MLFIAFFGHFVTTDLLLSALRLWLKYKKVSRVSENIPMCRGWRNSS